MTINRYVVVLTVTIACLFALSAHADDHFVESFDTLTNGYAATAADLPSGTWTVSQVYSEAPGDSRGGSGHAARINDDNSGAHLTTPALDTVGTVSFYYRELNDGGGTFKVQKSISGGAFEDVDSQAFSGNTYTFYTVDVDEGSSDVEIRILSDDNKGHLIIDDMTVTTGSSDDPNVSVSSTFDFGEIDPGTAATQTLYVVNSGPTLTLVVTGFVGNSGDTAQFTPSASYPLNILPAATGTIQVVYNPGPLTGATHSAVFDLFCNDPSDLTKQITFSGRTVPGLLSVSNIQYTTAGDGDSPWDGQEVDLRGICSYADSHGYVIADSSGGPWSGIYVDEDYHRPELGDDVRLSGTVNESSSRTILQDITEYVILSQSNAAPPPVVITAANEAQEQYESVLVCISNVTVSDDRVNSIAWEVSDGSGTCQVLHDRNRLLYRYIPEIGNTLDAVCGIMWQDGSTFRLQVRNDDDFVGRDVMHYALQGLVVTPDGPRTNWYVEILDDDIVGVTETAPPAVTVHVTGGIIFPGLIDSHNHPAWNSFPTLQFDNVPFGHRDDWGAGEQEYSDWKSKRSTVRVHSDVLASSKYTIEKYAEILELVSGCIAIQGNATSMEYTHPLSGIYNVEEFPSRVDEDIFPWTMTSSERTELTKKINGGAVNACLIHLSEGSDEHARAQFDTWESWGMLTNATTIIHGTPYTAAEFGKMAAAGAKLIWSPKSNMKLYESTVNLPVAKASGVVIGLAPDWTPSGSYNMLEELGYAWDLNTTIFSNACTAREMTEMVTLNNAIACGLDARYGKVAAGYNAGLVVISGDVNDPYMALINARPRTVLLTIIDGTPRYGDPTLMAGFGIVGETLNAWGTTKKFNLVTNHPFLTYDTETVADLMEHLTTAHNTLTTTNELDSEELQFLDLSLVQSGPDDVVPFVADNPLVAPLSGASYTINDAATLTFRDQDFWDNDTDNGNLIHEEIAIVAASQPDQALQVIASERANNAANETINFNVDFSGLHTNYYYRFLTRDLYGNVRTSVVDAVAFTVSAAAGDVDNDKLDDTWEQQIIDDNGGDGFITIGDVLPDGDYDSDGFSELEEQFAGTLPTDILSLLELSEVQVQANGGEMVFTWQSANARTYTLLACTNLVSRQFEVVQSGIVATPPYNSYTNTPSGDGMVVYGIRVEP